MLSNKTMLQHGNWRFIYYKRFEYARIIYTVDVLYLLNNIPSL